MNRGPCMPWIVLSAKCWLSTGARSSGSFKRPHDGHRPRSGILSAAAQVLAREGAQRFTTARVAERAGVSVGSVYQYFPNKASILFRLQSDEWRQTSDLLHDILQDGAKPPLERLRTLVLAFLRSECEEAAMRVALSDAPEAQEIKSSGDRVLHMLMREVLPGGSEPIVALATDLVTATLGAVGKQFSESPRTTQEIETYGEAMADMLCAYLENLRLR